MSIRFTHFVVNEKQFKVWEIKGNQNSSLFIYDGKCAYCIFFSETKIRIVSQLAL